jgi:predicted nucleotidyltransferase
MSELYLFTARRCASGRLERIVTDLKHANKTFGERACVYATGSFGRLEAGPDSDLDLFIVVETKSIDETKSSEPEKPLLNAVDEIKLKKELIDVVEKNGIANFDGGGRFLTSHTINSYTKWLGSNEDDYRNTLTGRMLLLLESRPLIGFELYQKTLDVVINKYFRDYTGHEHDFSPSFLFNDIIRMWRTFCVNYEFHRKDGDSRDKIKNLKLKFSRMLTCYSGVIYLMAVYARKGYVEPADVKAMVNTSPTARLEAITGPGFEFNEESKVELEQSAKTALAAYSQFLELTHKKSNQAVKAYNQNEAMWREKSYVFGHSLSLMIDVLGNMSPKSDKIRRMILI